MSTTLTRSWRGRRQWSGARRPSPLRDVPRSRSVEVRVPAFAFGNALSEMRRWLDHERCDPSRFTCVREGSGAVIIQVEFTKESEGLVDAFEQEFVAFSQTVSA